MKQFCVLVTSADGRKDIFNICFGNSKKIWAECDWPRYAGFTTEQRNALGFTMLASGIADDWCKSVAAHVNALPEHIRYILLMVEDVLFMRPINGEELNEVAYMAANHALKYVRLVPLRRNWLGRWIEALMSSDIGISSSFRFIECDEPYYSSTEMVLWERNYLLKQLARPGDAWSFEHHDGHSHWALRYPLFSQHQIVQKGRWNRLAPKLLAQADTGTGFTEDGWKTILTKGPRRFQTRIAQWRGWRENLSFALFGFLSFRIKRWLKI